MLYTFGGQSNKTIAVGDSVSVGNDAMPYNDKDFIKIFPIYCIGYIYMI